MPHNFLLPINKCTAKILFAIFACILFINAGNISRAEEADHKTTTTIEQSAQHLKSETEAAHHDEPITPSVFWIWPFVALLLCIALLPLIPATEHWWHKNSSKLLVATVLALITILYYQTREYGFPHKHEGHWAVYNPGMQSVLAVLKHAIIVDYIPFIVLLFSLYVCSGGINLTGDIRATPLNNTIIIAIGTVLANLIGTTGSAMLLIRPLLQINSERKYVRHTVIFFIFLCCNIGGCLLPIGDPPLFLGYLRGVPFLWTLQLFPEWIVASLTVLLIFYVWDSMAYKKEKIKDIQLDNTQIKPLSLKGGLNIIWLIGIVLSVALLVPDKKLLGMTIPIFFREGVMLTLVGVAWYTTNPEIRKANKFDFVAIGEVACLFIGIFIAMQIPLEILNLKGSEMPLEKPWHFFWITGTLSSFLDNAPTYVVFMQTAAAKTEALIAAGSSLEASAYIQTEPGRIEVSQLIAISIGAVFMGAMTYIGNGPNFMVKSIAESTGIKMPSFFGYMGYSIAILVPVMILISIIFL